MTEDDFQVVLHLSSQILLGKHDMQRGMNYAFHAMSESMNMGGRHLSQAFGYLFELSKRLNNPNLTIFATAFNPDMLSALEKIDAIDKLYTNKLK